LDAYFISQRKDISQVLKIHQILCQEKNAYCAIEYKKRMARLLDNGQLTFSTAVITGREKVLILS